MPAIVFGNRFKKDVDRMKKRGKDLRKLRDLLTTLESGKPIDQSCRPHKLSGEFSGMIDCHLEPDWVVIFEDASKSEGCVIMVRTGTHSDLFK